MRTRPLNRDAVVILKAAQQAGDQGLITPEIAMRLAKGFRAVLNLSAGERLFLLGKNIAENRTHDRNGYKQKSNASAKAANHKKRIAR